MSRRRPPPDDDDFSAFRQALREAGVRRIAHNRADPGRSRRQDAAAAERRAAAVAADSGEATSRTSDGRVEPVRPSQPLDFAVPDLPYRIRSQLKRGRIAWEAGLDLHGYTLDVARRELESFLREAAAGGQRCVLVVHGKAWGTSADYPVIKSHVNAWLREWPGVLAFCSAREADGGTGAVYVLLRRRGAHA
ncbi:DNA mismatch repair protein MutS [Halomonas campisalis]|uniref:DNA mismatch repair protein MutS n=1 Tax=Billgrantia campisalis TaxID=74661 RepID=A0ABS9PBA1_9GAMM|nr:Smr/MutS family protein [Halomonas campisalis]MCG6658724.1 DNA mismatch repair protein MutS [Halomonas campisalis]MDR5864011.1 Smr/MutS family protein [Halomonas campisalis]